MIKNLLSSIFFSLLALCSFAQDFSNKGKEFWLVFPAHIPSGGQQAQMGLFLTSDKNSSGTITVNGFSTTFNVTANTVTGPIDIPYANANVGTANTVVNKGIHVQVNAGQPAVVLYAHIYAGFRSEASLILPVNTLGKKYFSSNFWQASSGGSQSQFNIIATEPNTVVQYRLRKNGFLDANTTTVNLPNPGDQIQVQDPQDLSGSVIESIASGTDGCKKIAVFSGSSALSILRSGCNPPNNNISFDPLYQQCYPASTFGKNFGIVPLLNNTNGFHIRVIAAENNTVININGATINLNEGEYFPQTTSNPTPYTIPLTITADKPITVSQYLMSGACAGSQNLGGGNAQGDPDMIILNPVEQNISDINIFSSNLQAINTKFLNVYMKTASTGSFRINNAAPLNAFVPMPQNNGYSYLQEDLTGYLGNSFRLKADSGFNAITYGMGGAESYGYSAGTNVKDLFQQISVSSQFGIETTPSICVGSPFKFRISLPYQPLQLTWNLSSLPGNNPNVTQSPTATCTFPGTFPTFVCHDSTTFINGKQIWWYSLPNTYNINTVGNYAIAIDAQTNGADGCGAKQDIDFDLEVSATPIADFTFTQPTCAAEPVQFTDATVTAKPNYKWYWNFGEPSSGAANISSQKNPTHIYAIGGTYKIRFASITTPGCLSDTIEKSIVVPDLPTATIQGTVDICQNGTQPTITFEGAKGTLPYTFTYNINGGAAQTISTVGTATKATINVPTNTAGTFVYNLTSIKNTNSTLCVNPVNGQLATIKVNPLPTATITGTTTVCNFSTSPNIIFTGANGTAPYTFTYTLNGGVAQTITTMAGNSAIVAAPTTLVGTFNYALVSVKDASSTNCFQTQTGNAIVTINERADATIIGANELCLNAPQPDITFTAIGGVAPYTFTYNINGGANQTITSITGNTVKVSAPTNTAGTFVYNLISVQESSNANCLNTGLNKSVTVIINPKPTASFTNSTPLCANSNVTITPTFTPTDGSVTEWLWNYADGAGNQTRPNGNEFTVAYATTGLKTITFQTKTNKGCESDVFTNSITINDNPIAGFINPEVCLADGGAQFVDTSKVANGTIVFWDWDFGDPTSTTNTVTGSTNAEKNPSHKYTTAGPKTVKLIVTSNNGCKTTITQTFTVNSDIPIAGFSIVNPTTNCANAPVEIKDNSTVNIGNVSKVEIYWDNTANPTVFESDDLPTIGKVYAHNYPNIQIEKTYRIRYRAYSGATCVNDFFANVLVHAAPLVQFDAIPNVCINNGIIPLTQASEIGSVPGGPGVYSGNGVTGNEFNPLTAGVGTHILTYTFTSTFGCIDSKTQTIKVLEAPIANFATVGNLCIGNNVTFNQTATSNEGVITQWKYNWGDGSAEEIFTDGGNKTHTYIGGTTFTVSLTVVTIDGCNSLPKTINITLNPQPQPNFTFTQSACLPKAIIDFTNTTINISDWAYKWNFNEPSSLPQDQSSSVNPSYVYTNIGPHNVKLTATSGLTGCTNDTVIVVNTIHPAPTASFVFDKESICVNDAVTVIDNSTFADGSSKDWVWNYGDAAALFDGQMQQPHTYNRANTYNVKLTITNSFGCVDDTVRQFTVNPFPIVNAGADLFMLEGGSIILPAVATGNELTYLWSSIPTPEYLNNKNLLQPTAKPLVDINYTITVTAKGGCATTDDVLVKVLKFPLIPNTFTPNNDGIHDTWEIKYLFTYPDNKVQIFTRTGQLVFESKGYKTPWDGNVKGKSLPFDTYYYIIEPGNGRKPITGYVTIIK